MSGKVYVSGPMTGVVDFNRPAFALAQERLEAEVGLKCKFVAPKDGIQKNEQETRRSARALPQLRR